MSFPIYPEYKDSGVDWLGEVPSHWHVTLLKRGYEVVLGKMLQPEAKREDDELLPYLRAANIQAMGVDTDDVKRMWFSVEEKKSLLLRRGDLLVSEGGDVGRSAIWNFDGECYFQNSINRIRSVAGNDTRFLYFWMNAIKNKGYIDVLCNKSTIAHFTAEKVAAVPLPIPPKHEQTQIARFLDHETARIDALIEEQQRLIELLKEKRQAVISHAVTKGLDPTVPMKLSGVEWLGEVPAHWTVRKVSVDFLASKGPRGALLTKEYCHENAGEYPVYSGQTENGGILGEIADFDIDLGAEGAILSTTVGAKAMSVMHISGRISLSQNCMIIRPLSSDVKVRFFFYHFQPLFSLERRMIPDHMQPSFRMEDLYSFRVAVPPVSEQNQIAEYLDDAVNRFDELIGEGDNGIALLQERRSALISAAVTGKIDVRGWQPPASTQAPELAVAEAV